MNTHAFIDVRHVSCILHGQEVLHDISLQIERGAYMGIVGPNGGGKTTLLKVILGLLTPSTGSILIDGVAPKVARLRGALGYVPQRAAQEDPHCPATVEEVVRSGLHAERGLFGRMRPDDRRMILEVMERTGVIDLRHRMISELSGGQRQKVFIARALASSPHMLVLDEPMTGIDAPSQQAFSAMLRTLHADGLTLVIVSHDADAIARDTTGIFCINRTLVSCSTEYSHAHHHH